MNFRFFIEFFTLVNDSGPKSRFLSLNILLYFSRILKMRYCEMRSRPFFGRVFTKFSPSGGPQGAGLRLSLKFLGGGGRPRNLRFRGRETYPQGGGRVFWTFC